MYVLCDSVEAGACLLVVRGESPEADDTSVIQYLYIRHSNLYILALTKRNTNAAEILLFLHKLVEVFTEYFKVLEEESIRDNFVIIYELLDEMMDYGYPQTTESKILQECVVPLVLVHSRPPELTWGVSPNQVHHSRIAQARYSSPTTYRRYKRSVMAK